jgi:hypothetical protein
MSLQALLLCLCLSIHVQASMPEIADTVYVDYDNNYKNANNVYDEYGYNNVYYDNYDTDKEVRRLLICYSPSTYMCTYMYVCMCMCVSKYNTNVAKVHFCILNSLIRELLRDIAKINPKLKSLKCLIY